MTEKNVNIYVTLQEEKDINVKFVAEKTDIYVTLQEEKDINVKFVAEKTDIYVTLQEEKDINVRLSLSGGEGSGHTHSNKAILDAIQEALTTSLKSNYDTAYSHTSLTNNPHSVTASQVGLGNVTNDAQLKREAGDFNSFTVKSTLSSNDIILIEDSENGYTKKKATVGSLGGGGGYESLFTIDTNGDLMPVEETVTDQFFELDTNDDIMPKAA